MQAPASVSDVSKLTLSAEEEAAALGSIRADLSAILFSCELPRALMVLIGHSGFTSLGLFRTVASSDEDFRKWLTGPGMEFREDSPSFRLHAALMLNVWETAKDRKKHDDQVSNELSALGVPKQLPAYEHDSLDVLFETAYPRQGEMTKAKAPAKSYVDLLVGWMEHNVLQAEKLTDVVNRQQEDAAPGPRRTEMLPRGSTLYAVLPKRVTTGPPRTTEELRDTYRLMSRAWAFAALKLPGHHAGRNAEDNVWEPLADFICSEHVLKREILNADGKCRAYPSFQLALRFEQALRERVLRQVNRTRCSVRESLSRHLDLEDEWGKATYEKEFKHPLNDILTLPQAAAKLPTQVAGSGRGAPETPNPGGKGQPTPGKPNPGADDGKKTGGKKRRGSKKNKKPSDNPAEGDKPGKGKQKGDKRKGPPAGSAIPNTCWAWNRNDCKRKSCRFKHVCSICGGAHMAINCDKQSQSGSE